MTSGTRRDTMNAFESLMWRVETVSPLRSTCVAVEVLAGVPTWERFVASHERLVARTPRLRQRVVDPPGTLAMPRWSADPDFDLHRHLGRRRVLGVDAWARLLQLGEQIAVEEFDRTRPPWEAILVQGLPGGRSAYLLKLHHAISDGLGIMSMLAALHSSADAAPDDRRASTARTLTPVDAVRLELTERAAGLPAQAGRLVRATLRRAGSPTHAVRSDIAYLASLRRVLTPPSASRSPLLVGRSTAWRFAALDVDFGALRAAAKMAGGSVNDAYLAALLGGYRRYHEALGRPVTSVPVGIPISLRAAADADGGNEIASTRLAGPVAEVDPAVRIAAIGAMVRRSRGEPAMNNINTVTTVLARLPTRWAASVLGAATAANDLQASNVPGPAPYELAGVPVEALYGWAPLPGCPAMITLISYAGNACVGVNFDPAAFTAEQLFVSALREGFDEVLALADRSARPTTAR